MCAGLIGDDVDLDFAGAMTAKKLGENLSSIALDANGQCFARSLRGQSARHGVIKRVGNATEVAFGLTAFEARAIGIGNDAHTAVERHRERLCAAHATTASGEGDRALEGSTETLARDRSECFEGALKDSLRGDVDPGAGGHLAVHHETFGLELAELRPRCPVTNEVGVSD